MADRMVLDLADPEELSLIARALPFPSGILHRWLPARTRTDHRYRFFRGDRAMRSAAPVRPWDTPAVPVDRGTAEEVTGRMLPISVIAWLLEEEAQLLDAARGSQDEDAVARVFGDDTINLTRRVLQRVMLMQGEAISQGRVTIGTQASPENRLQLGSVDFGLPSAHNITAGTLWNASTPGIFGQLAAYKRQYVTTTGQEVTPGVAITSTRVLEVMLADPETRALVGSILGTPVTIGVTQINQLLADRQLPRLVIDDTAVLNHNGVMTRQIPDDRIVLLPEDPANGGIPVGSTQWGLTEEAKKLARSQAISAENAPGLVSVPMESENPVRTGTLVTGIAMPVIEQPDLVFVAKVL